MSQMTKQRMTPPPPYHKLLLKCQLPPMHTNCFYCTSIFVRVHIIHLYQNNDLISLQHLFLSSCQLNYFAHYLAGNIQAFPLPHRSGSMVVLIEGKEKMGWSDSGFAKKAVDWLGKTVPAIWLVETGLDREVTWPGLPGQDVAGGHLASQRVCTALQPGTGRTKTGWKGEGRQPLGLVEHLSAAVTQPSCTSLQLLTLTAGAQICKWSHCLLWNSPDMLGKSRWILR